MKKSILALCAAVALSSAVVAMPVQVITNFGGDSAPAGRFYVPVMGNDLSLVLGFTSTVYTSSDKSVAPSVTKSTTAQLLLGTNQTLPFLGNFDVYGVFNLPGVVNASGASVLEKIVVSKNWMYKLADKVQVGIMIPLLEVYTDGTSKVDVLASVKPQVGVSIDL